MLFSVLREPVLSLPAATRSSFFAGFVVVFFLTVQPQVALPQVAGPQVALLQSACPTLLIFGE